MAATALRPQHERFARVESLRLGGVPVSVEWLPYGVGAEGARAGAASADAAAVDAAPSEIVATYGLLEMEYSAFRRSAAVMDRCDRATLLVSGADRVEFLNRMVTQDLKGLAAGQVRQAFWLNRKGRIDADLLLCQLPTFMLVDVDCHDAAGAVKTLGDFIFSEDVQIRDASAEWLRLSIHGPGALELLRAAGASDELQALQANLSCATVTMQGAQAVIARRDQCAACGLELFVPAQDAARVFDALVDVPDRAHEGRKLARPAGWYAYNMARIEGGTPLFHVDFGHDNLPHETGVLQQRTSFTKGCYLGQEIVARMESLGKPKQQLIALKLAQDLLPTAGSPVFERAADGEPTNPVGNITSSALSPILGAVPMAFAMVKTTHAKVGTVLAVPAEGGRADATVRAQLAFIDAHGKAVP